MEFAATLVSTILGGLLVVLLARLLSPDGYGLLYLTLAVLGVAKLFAKLGLPRSTARYISEYKEKDETQLQYIIRFSIIVALLLICIVSIVVLAGRQVISELIGEPDISSFLLVGVLFLFFGTLFGFVRSILQGFEAIESAAKLSIIKSVSKFCFVLGFVLAGFGALGALAGYALASTLVSILGIGLVYFRYYRQIDRTASAESDLGRRITEYAVPLTASEAAGVLSGRIDKILIGFFLNPVSVSFYVVSEQVVQFIQSPVNALGFTLAPTFGAEKAKGDLQTAARIYEESYIKIMLLYVPAAVGIILVAEPLVILVFGTDYLGAVPVLRVFGLYAIVQANLLISAKGLDFLGRARSRAIANGITSILNVALNIILIPIIGVVGAAIATVLTSSIYTLFNIYLIYDELPLHLDYLLNQTLLVTMISVAMGTVVHQLSVYIHGWVTLIMVVCVGVLIWAVLSILFGLLEPNKIINTLI
jgi:O-antigen/teichoic acid export membrane protein